MPAGLRLVHEGKHRGYPCQLRCGLAGGWPPQELIGRLSTIATRTATRRSIREPRAAHGRAARAVRRSDLNGPHSALQRIQAPAAHARIYYARSTRTITSTNPL